MRGATMGTRGPVAKMMPASSSVKPNAFTSSGMKGAMHWVAAIRSVCKQTTSTRLTSSLIPPNYVTKQYGLHFRRERGREMQGMNVWESFYECVNEILCKRIGSNYSIGNTTT